MAHASLVNGGVTRISGVWTPVELRGRGYASAVVAALSSERMDAGESCMLFTDLANPTSNKIYQAMGYRRIGDNITIEFLGPVATR
jgi:predicted GNAT family acetyltransferase